MNASDVRKIAQLTPHCVELRQVKKHAHVLSFLKATEPEPARIQIYLDSGTVVILRVLNGAVRHIFIPKCKLKKLEQIFKDPQTLSLTDMDQQLQLDKTTKTSTNNNTTPMTEDFLLEVGEAVLAAESQALKAHYQSLTKKSEYGTDSQRSSCLYHFTRQDVEKEVDNITKSSKNIMDMVECVAMNGNCAIFVHPKRKGWNVCGKAPQGLWKKITETKSKLSYVSLGSKGRYYASFKNKKTDWDGPKAMDLLFLVRPVQCVAFGAGINDIIVVYKDGSWKNFGKMPKELENILNHPDGRRKDIDCITLGCHGEYFVRNTEGTVWWGGLSKKVGEIFDGKLINYVDFGDAPGTFIMVHS